MLRPGLLLLRGVKSIRVTPAWAIATLLGSLFGSVPGCGTDAFVPPPDPELSAITDSYAVKPSPTITMILPPGRSDDRDTYTLAARQQAGKAKVGLRFEQVPTDATAKDQAGLIRSAASRGASVLLVEAADHPDVVEALNEVRDRGTAVILLMNDVPSRDKAKPFKRLAFVPFDQPAVVLVKAVLDDAKSTGLAADGHALIVGDQKRGETADALTSAIKASLTASHVKNISELKTEGDSERDKATVLAKLVEDEKISMILATDAQSLAASISTVATMKSNRAVSIGGCQSIDRQLNASSLAGTVGIVERNLPNFGREAILSAVRLAKGETLPNLMEIPMPFRSSSGFAVPLKPTPARENAKSPENANKPPTAK